MSVIVYVIGSESSFLNNNHALSDCFTGSIRFREGIWFNGNPPDGICDEEAFRSIFGRLPNSGEVGCALAHRNVYEEFSNASQEWALILEDDSIIRDEAVLQECLQQVMSSGFARHPTIASFFTRQFSAPLFIKLRQPLECFVELERPVTSTLGYLINQKAAAQLTLTQTPVQSTADWPRGAATCSFLLTNKPVLDHSPDPTSIGSRPNRSRFFEAQLISGVWYVRYRRYFLDFRDYVWLLIKPRIRERSQQLLDVFGQSRYRWTLGTDQDPK